MKNVELHLFPGVLHGYMMRAAPAFNQPAYDFSMERALGVLQGLRN
jgi:carboxymethylenebutenolidase